MKINYFYLLFLAFPILNPNHARAILEENIAIYQINSVVASIPNYEKLSTLSETALHTELAKMQREKEAAAAIVKRRKLEEAELRSIHEKERLKLQGLEAQHQHAKEEAKRAEAVLKQKESEEKALIESLGTIEDARFILKLQSSPNPRIKDSVETYKSFFNMFREFEASYSPIPNLKELLPKEAIESLQPEDNQKLERIYKRLNEILNDSTQKARLFDILFSTRKSQENHQEIINLVNLENLSLNPIRIPTYTMSGDIVIQDTHKFITYLFDNAADILQTFVVDNFRKLINEDSREGSRNMWKDFSLTPAYYFFPFHSFTPAGRSGNSPWKMHISGKNFMAWKIFKYVLPYMVQNKRYFKVYRDIKGLHSFYYEGGLPQTGKFFTVYPENDAESTELARDLNDLMNITGFDPSNFPAVPNDVKVGSAVGVYGRYEGHSHNSHYDRLVPWGDELNADRLAACPFAQGGINIRWEKEGTTLVESWDKRPTTWAKLQGYIPSLATYQFELNDEGRRIIGEGPPR